MKYVQTFAMILTNIKIEGQTFAHGNQIGLIEQQI
jgi:hypothetical protein